MAAGHLYFQQVSQVMLRQPAWISSRTCAWQDPWLQRQLKPPGLTVV